jgi:hypothetical protein
MVWNRSIHKAYTKISPKEKKQKAVLTSDVSLSKSP